MDSGGARSQGGTLSAGGVAERGKCGQHFGRPGRKLSGLLKPWQYGGYMFVFIFVSVFVLVILLVLVDRWINNHCGYAPHQGA